MCRAEFPFSHKLRHCPLKRSFLPTSGVLAVKELLPDAGIPKPCNRKAQKAKKGARSTEFKGDLEALVAAADDVKLEATVPAAEEVERNNDSGKISQLGYYLCFRSC